MYETPADLDHLQGLIDVSMASASVQLRSIAHEGRRLSADQVAEILQGKRQMAVATVTAS